jgi:hypothetical protein
VKQHPCEVNFENDFEKVLFEEGNLAWVRAVLRQHIVCFEAIQDLRMVGICLTFSPSLHVADDDCIDSIECPHLRQAVPELRFLHHRCQVLDSCE